MLQNRTKRNFSENVFEIFKMLAVRIIFDRKNNFTIKFRLPDYALEN